jgi:hypothetical protein
MILPYCGVIMFLHLLSPPIQCSMLELNILKWIFFIREKVIRKDLQVKFVSTVDQLADIFTKGLPSPRFQDLQSKLLVPVDTIHLRGDEEVNDK